MRSSRLHPLLLPHVEDVEPGRIVRVAEHDGYVVEVLVVNQA